MDGSKTIIRPADETTSPSDTVPDQFNNRFYGAFWLLEQLSRQSGIYDDLLSVFQGNAAVVNEVITMAIYPYLSNRNFNRMARWQRGHKTAVDYDLTASYITRSRRIFSNIL